MTRYEKVIWPPFLLVLLWQLAPTPGHAAGLFLLDWLLMLSYLAGGYWVLAGRAAPPPLVRIAGGICLGTSLWGLLPALEVRLSDGWWYQWLPAASVLLCLGLGMLLLLRWHRRRVRYAYWPLFWRALLVGAVCSLLTYSSVWFAPYRQVLLLYNRSRPAVRANLLMFDYYARFEQALAAHDTTAASAYLRQSIANGRRWLAGDSVREAYRASGVLTKAYDAYRIQGDTAYARADFAGALPFYRAANQLLQLADTRQAVTDKPSDYWEGEKALALENIGLCLSRLGRYPASDSAFLAAIRIVRHLPPQPWHTRLLTDLAASFSKEQYVAQTNYLYRLANRKLATDTTRVAQTSRTHNLLAICLNLLNQDSTVAALRQLHLLTKQPLDSATILTQQLYESIGYYKLARFAEARKLLLRLQQTSRPANAPGRSEQLAAQLLLARTELALADYRQARTDTEAAATAWRRLPQTGNTGDLAIRPVLAAIDEAIGDYQAASQQLAPLLLASPNAASPRQLFYVLLQAAELAMVQDHLPEAHQRLAAAQVLAQLPTPTQTQLLAVAADLHYLEGAYALATAGYRRVLVISRQFGQPVDAATAAAYEGLGLVALARHELPAADSLLRQSVAQHETIYTAHHPLTASAYLSYGRLRLQQQQPAAADALFQQARTVAQEFLPASHDFFGDLNLALGDLARHRQQARQAQAYYEQALAIYRAKFGTDHWKTRLAQRKVAR